jgi:tRNA-splicing ligase RtcB (3'-phosphate/5'-hydroxy nucleic acid ligase)
LIKQNYHALIEPDAPRRVQKRSAASRRTIARKKLRASSAVKMQMSSAKRRWHKSIDAVMEAQRDLVDVVHTLRQMVCVKG